MQAMDDKKFVQIVRIAHEYGDLGPQDWDVGIRSVESWFKSETKINIKYKSKQRVLKALVTKFNLDDKFFNAPIHEIAKKFAELFRVDLKVLGEFAKIDIPDPEPQNLQGGNQDDHFPMDFKSITRVLTPDTAHDLYEIIGGEFYLYHPHTNPKVVIRDVIEIGPLSDVLLKVKLTARVSDDEIKIYGGYMGVDANQCLICLLERDDRQRMMVIYLYKEIIPRKIESLYGVSLQIVSDETKLVPLASPVYLERIKPEDNKKLPDDPENLALNNHPMDKLDKVPRQYLVPDDACSRCQSGIMAKPVEPSPPKETT